MEGKRGEELFRGEVVARPSLTNLNGISGGSGVNPLPVKMAVMKIAMNKLGGRSTLLVRNGPP